MENYFENYPFLGMHAYIDTGRCSSGPSYVNSKVAVGSSNLGLISSKILFASSSVGKGPAPIHESAVALSKNNPIMPIAAITPTIPNSLLLCNDEIENFMIKRIVYQ